MESDIIVLVEVKLDASSHSVSMTDLEDKSAELKVKESMMGPDDKWAVLKESDYMMEVDARLVVSKEIESMMVQVVKLGDPKACAGCK
jgi:hypothetical protein